MPVFDLRWEETYVCTARVEAPDRATALANARAALRAPGGTSLAQARTVHSAMHLTAEDVKEEVEA
jgi:hypothetical protein